MARQQEQGEGLIGLLRETADSLGQLIADHVKLARIELAADAKSYGRGLTTLLIAVLVLTIGYAFAWTAIALVLVRYWGAPVAFGAVAAIHVAGGGMGLAAALRRMQRTRLMRESATEASRSVTALAHSLERHAS